jgi:hypothetical protein
MRYAVLLAIATLSTLICGCKKPQDPTISGAFISKGTPATLRLQTDRFSLKEGENIIEGECALIGDTLTLIPKTLNGKNENDSEQKALMDAQTIGKVTDMEVLGSIFRNVALKMEQGGKVLAVEPQRLLQHQQQPYYNSFVSFEKSL